MPKKIVTKFTRNRSERGLTLLEVMIVVMIIGILAAIAIPNYQNYVIRSTRAEATTLILDLAQQLERCYTRFSAYNDANCGLQNDDQITSEKLWYIATVSVPDRTSFSITAVPQGVQASRDTQCNSFTYTHTGRRGITGPGDVQFCW